MSEQSERGVGRRGIATSLAWFPAEDYDEAITRWPSLAEDWANHPHDECCRHLQWELLRLSSHGVPMRAVAPIQLADYLPWCEKRGKSLQIDTRAPARQAGGHWFEPSTAHRVTSN